MLSNVARILRTPSLVRRIRQDESGHLLYTPEDFTAEEYARGNILAMAVIRDGRSVCKRCGASDGQLRDFGTCRVFRMHKRGRPFDSSRWTGNEGEYPVCRLLLSPNGIVFFLIRESGARMKAYGIMWGSQRQFWENQVKVYWGHRAWTLLRWRWGRWDKQ